MLEAVNALAHAAQLHLLLTQARQFALESALLVFAPPLRFVQSVVAFKPSAILYCTALGNLLT